MPHYEIERKFRVEGDFMPYVTNTTHIQQGYICSGKGRTVRVRIRDEKAYLTIKGPGGVAGLKRYEFEQEIPMSDAIELMRICEPGIVDKHRHLVPVGKHVFEVDVFHGDNEGLVMAEVELESEDEAFERPEWLGREVTGNRRYYNSHMRGYPYSMWTEEERQ